MSTSDPATAQAVIAQAVADYVTAMLSHPGAFRGQQLRGGGPVAEFEILLSERTGFQFCLATSSATSALLVAALGLDLAGKKIAVEAGAWEGSLGALEFAGAELVEVDSLLTAPLGESSAVLATDRPGQRHNAAGVRERCDKAGIKYIEDTGWLPGTTAPEGRLSVADVQVISFGPGKPMSLGEGGALLCRDKSLYDHAVAISQHPERAIAEGIDCFNHPPLNARIHPLAAVIGVVLLTNNVPCRKRSAQHEPELTAISS
jgi:dTDP-4-amino-4,6-dideoxygalactose transaminase